MESKNYCLESRPKMARPGQVQQAVLITQPPSAVPPPTINRETSASSRFHIIKIETGPYKRGRWNCRDFDDAASSSTLRSDMIAVGPRSGSSSDSSGRPSYHIIAEENGHTAGDPTLLILTANDHSIAHLPAAQSSKPPLPPGHQHSPLPQSKPHVDPSSKGPVKQPSVTSNGTGLTHQRSQSPSNRFQVRPTVDLNNAAAAILDSIVGSMHDNNRIVMGSTSRQSSASNAVSTGSTAATVDGPVGGSTVGMGQAVGSVGANVVAIDNKIEQAMDLVKTHLLYAVREEVEVLKEKIIDLEKKVFRLETENKLLREYAPPEILQQIQHQHHPQSQAGASLVNSQTNAPPPAQSISISHVQQQQTVPQATVVQTVPSQSAGTVSNPQPGTGSLASTHQPPQ